MLIRLFWFSVSMLFTNATTSLNWSRLAVAPSSIKSTLSVTELTSVLSPPKSDTSSGMSDLTIPVGVTIVALFSTKSDCLFNIIFVGFDINSFFIFVKKPAVQSMVTRIYEKSTAMAERFRGCLYKMFQCNLISSNLIIKQQIFYVFDGVRVRQRLARAISG